MSDIFVGKYKGYPIYVSNRKHKKYFAIVDNKKIHFGDTRYEHFEDKMKYYQDLDHYDEKRRKNYKARHENNRHNKGKAGWFSDQILW